MVSNGLEALLVFKKEIVKGSQDLLQFLSSESGVFNYPNLNVYLIRDRNISKFFISSCKA